MIGAYARGNATSPHAPPGCTAAELAHIPRSPANTPYLSLPKPPPAVSAARLPRRSRRRPSLRKRNVSDRWWRRRSAPLLAVRPDEWCAVGSLRGCWRYTTTSVSSRGIGRRLRKDRRSCRRGWRRRVARYEQWVRVVTVSCRGRFPQVCRAVLANVSLTVPAVRP